MKFLNAIFFVISLFLFNTAIGQANYKDLMQDPNVNFYDVCAAADAYFATIDKDAKGSGWKGYQRWKYVNESKYYPSGDRSMEDPYYVRKAYEQFILENPRDKALFDGGWEEVGPVNIDSITGHYSAGLGRLETFYVDPTDEDVMYIGTRSGGFWKSEDGGAIWEGGSTDFLFASGVNTIAVSPTNNDSILINVRNSGNGTTHGIYRSTDGGDSWVETNYNPLLLGKGGLGSNFQVNQIKYHPTIPNLIFVAANDGLYRSDNNLSTWVKVTNGSISQIEFHPTDASIIYIYDYYYWGPNKNKVLRSTDYGVTFVGSADIAGNADNTNVHFDVSPLCEDCLYFASGTGLWKSFDSGITFNFVSNPGMSSEGFAVNDMDTSKMTYGGIDGFASTDGGLTFHQTTWWSLGSAAHGAGSYQERYAGSSHYIHADVRYTGSVNGVFYMATDGQFARSYDSGETWEQLGKDIGIRENYTLGVSQSNHYKTMVGSQDNGTSIKHKDGWMEFWGADGMEAIIHPLNSDWMIGSNQYGGRRRTFNGGVSQDGASPPGHSSGWVAPLCYDPNDHMTVYHFGELVHKSSDFGSTWTNPGTPGFSGTIDEAAIAENNSNIIIVSKGQNIERSTDGGLTFVNIKGTLPNYGITDIAFDPSRDSTFVVTYNRYQDDGQKIYITHDLGNTWTNITSNLNKMPIRGAVIDHTPERNIYLAAEIGVYVKGIDETDWVLYNDELPNCMVYELEVIDGSNSIRAATWGRGVWEYTLRDRASYPTILITEITDQPSMIAPAEESEQFVTSKITYDFDITEAYVKWSIDAPTFENRMDMTNTIDSTWVSNEPLPDYPSGTKIFFKVFAIGEAGDTTETYKFMYTVRPYEYCQSYGNMSWATSVTLIDFSDLNNPSGKPAAYTSYVDLDTAHIYPGEDYELTMNMNTDGAYTIHGAAWIDWNRDGDFTDPGEAYDLGTTYDSPDGISTLSPLTITVPLDAHIGKTTMRVAAKYGTDPSPCETGYDGEVEDYTIFVKPLIELDYVIYATDICQGDYVTFEYTGSYLDAIDWSFTNGDVTYTSDEMIGGIAFEEPGDYNLLLFGYEGEISDFSYGASVIHVHPNYEEVAEALICNGDELEFGTQTLTEAGVYVEPFLSTFGCDSIVTMTLSVQEVDVLVSVSDYELTANALDVSYQWLDCNADWAEIVGATEQVFAPLENGSYAVIINDGLCQDTSACYDIVALSLDELEDFGVNLFPNPNAGEFVLGFDDVIANLNVQIHDVAGRLIYVNEYQNTSNINLDLEVATGVYYIVLTGVQLEKIVLKLIIE